MTDSSSETDARTFESVRMPGTSFHDVDLSDATFYDVYLTGAQFRDVLFKNVRMRGVALADVDISGEIENVSINGVDVGPMVEAELDRRDPDRPLMRPSNAEGFRAGYDLIQRRWAETVERARRLDPALLHESVDGEWSFTQTLRHLAFASESWVARAILGDPSPWHPLSLPWDEMRPHPAVPWDRDARPSLEEALALRESRVAMVRGFLDDLTDERLADDTEPVDAPGWPPPHSFPVRECLLTVLNEEYHHRLYAERDLASLTRGTG